MVIYKMVNLVGNSVSMLKHNFESMLQNAAVMNALAAGVVFIILASPTAFRTVDNIIKVHDKNVLLAVHGLVAALLHYFLSIYLFRPTVNALREGYVNNKRKK